MDHETTQFTVLRVRWYVLFVAAIYNITNAIMWISFAPAAVMASEFYGVSITAINMFAVCYFILSIPMMFVATWVIDKHGLKTGLQIGCAIQFTAATIRLFGTFDFVPQNGLYPISIIGQCLMATAQPFAMGVPTKVSDSWFPTTERIAATALISMSNPLGIMLGQVITPLIVDDRSDIPAMNITVCALAMAAAVTAAFVPQRKAHHSAESTFARDLKSLLTNKYYIVLLITVGGAIALVSVLLTYFSQMMCPLGYTDEFSGMCAALMLIFSFIGSALATIIAMKTKLYKEITKVMFAIAALSALALVLCLEHSDLEAGIITTSILFGFVGFAAYPLFLELAAECTYPIDESKSAGFIITSSQIIGIIMVLVLELIAQPATDEIMETQTCIDKCSDSESEESVRDMTIPNMFMAGVGCFIAILFIFGYRGKYHRMEAENAKRALEVTTASTEQIIDSEDPSHD